MLTHPDILTFFVIVAVPIALLRMSRGRSRDQGLRLIILGTLWISAGALFDAIEHLTFLGGISAWLSKPQFNWVISLAFYLPGVAALMAGLFVWFPNAIQLADEIQRRVRTEERLRESEHRFRSLVEHAPEAITIIDAETGHYVDCNPRAEELHGYPKSEIVGKGPAAFSPEFQSDGRNSKVAAQDNLDRAANGDVLHFEWLHSSPNGDEFPCDVHLARLPDPNRQLVRASVTDISERKANERDREHLQQQFAAAQRLEAIGKLTGGVAHDFTNVLAVILGNQELLKDKLTEEPLISLVDSSIAAVQRGADLTKSMLSFARQAQLEPEIIDLNRLVTDTRSWAGRVLPASIDVETSLLAGLWAIEADPSSTESALLNLLLNAKDAMPSGGKLTIETGNVRIDEDYIDTRNETIEPGRYVMLAVSDTGEGIPVENLVRVFEPFFTTKPVGEGSGLGLSMIEGFMRQSGGAIQVYSEVGVGTTFKLYFRAKGKTEASGRKASAKAGVDASGERVLVVEDEPEVLAIIVTTLSEAGYQVASASSGDEALEIYKLNPDFDLLLTDIVMPGSLQGTNLSKTLRGISPGLKVVFMSGYASEATVHGNGLRPEDIRLMKPVSRASLLQAIRKALEHHPLKRS